MWAVMMAAMMLPGAMPAILRQRGALRRLEFAAGYFGVWTAFSAVAAAAQFALQSAELLSEDMALRSSIAAFAAVAAVVLYQLTPWKRRFLIECRARNQLTGTRYGLSCLGSSGPLMMLLFVVGVMSVPWMLALTLWVVVEKTAPWGRRIAGTPFDKG
jgi:predicted metal-binding membrane protein